MSHAQSKDAIFILFPCQPLQWQVTRSVHGHGKLIIENFVLIKEVSVIAIRAINH